MKHTDHKDYQNNQKRTQRNKLTIKTLKMSTTWFKTTTQRLEMNAVNGTVNAK